MSHEQMAEHGGRARLSASSSPFQQATASCVEGSRSQTSMCWRQLPSIRGAACQASGLYNDQRERTSGSARLQAGVGCWVVLKAANGRCSRSAAEGQVWLRRAR